MERTLADKSLVKNSIGWEGSRDYMSPNLRLVAAGKVGVGADCLSCGRRVHHASHRMRDGSQTIHEAQLMHHPRHLRPEKDAKRSGWRYNTSLLENHIVYARGLQAVGKEKPNWAGPNNNDVEGHVCVG